MPYLRAFLSIFILMAVLPQARSEEPVTLPGGVWAIVPPQGFEITHDPILAFRHPAGASIVVQDEPRTPITLAEFERERIAAERAGTVLPGQLRIDEATEVTVDGKRALLIFIYSPTQKRTNLQLQIEGEQLNGVIDAAVADGVTAVSVEDLKQALLTAVERPTEMQDRLASLPFVIGDLASLRIARITIGPAVILTDGPSDYPGQAADQIFAIVQMRTLPTAPPDFRQELTGMTAETRRMFPDANNFSARVIEEGGEQIVQITYRRLIGRPGTLVAGVTWTKVNNGLIVTAICQYPLANGAAEKRLRKVFDSVAGRRS